MCLDSRESVTANTTGSPVFSSTRASATESPGGPWMVFSTSFASTSSSAAQTAPVSAHDENGPIRTVMSAFEAGVTVTSQRSFSGLFSRRARVTFSAEPPWRTLRVSSRIVR